jgi:hypothetical protein
MGTQRTRKDFWNSNLQANKVRTVLEGLGGDLEAFEKGYKSTRKTREMRPIAESFDADQIAALRAFPTNPDLGTLARALNRSDAGAASVFARAIKEGIVKVGS